MELLPEWAPNVHPILVHFPIALLVIAVLFDGAALFLRKRPGVRTAAVALFTLGATAALAAFFTGRAAADEILLPAAAQTTLTDHADWALLTVWFFGLYALARLALLRFDHKGRRWAQGWAQGLVFLIGAGGLFLLAQTGDRGAKMVFQYGVGVQAAPQDDLVRHDHDTDHAQEMENDHDAAPHDHVMADSMVARPTVAENGSWQWAPGPGARQVLEEDFQFLEGSLEDLKVTEHDSLVALDLQRGTVLFVMDIALESIQADLMLNLEQFDGSVRLVHHVQDAQTYDFLALEDGMIRQGRMSQGEVDVFEEKTQALSGFLAMRAVSDGRHFRGYMGEEMRVHGHGSPPESGTVGLRLEGMGTVRLKHFSVTALRQ